KRTAVPSHRARRDAAAYSNSATAIPAAPAGARNPADGSIPPASRSGARTSRLASTQTSAWTTTSRSAARPSPDGSGSRAPPSAHRAAGTARRRGGGGETPAQQRSPREGQNSAL